MYNELLQILGWEWGRGSRGWQEKDEWLNRIGGDLEKIDPNQLQFPS